MFEDPHEHLEKRHPLHAQSDTGCNKAQRAILCCLNMKKKKFIRHCIAFINPPYKYPPYKYNWNHQK